MNTILQVFVLSMVMLSHSVRPMDANAQSATHNLDAYLTEAKKCFSNDSSGFIEIKRTPRKLAKYLEQVTIEDFGGHGSNRKKIIRLIPSVALRTALALQFPYMST